jgi:hypothetical protein
MRGNMPLPGFESGGYLPPGIYEVPLAEVRTRFGIGSQARQQQFTLVQRIVEAARPYPTIKRLLVWGSFVTAKPEPGDLDYSIVVSVEHPQARIARQHRRFFVAADARRYYGADRSYLVIKDYPLDVYVDRLDCLCQTRDGLPRGIVEINIRGEFPGEMP